MQDMFSQSEGVSFCTPSPKTDQLLKQGVVAYRSDRQEADRLFRQALAEAPGELSAYFCLYKIHCYMGRLDEAADFATSGMREAARQAGWADDPSDWPRQTAASDGAARFALFTLKALSFIDLKRGRREEALQRLATLAIVDPANSVGWSVIRELSEGAQEFVV
jgi:tetratricopeptide (TPR) repeat protein